MVRLRLVMMGSVAAGLLFGSTAGAAPMAPRERQEQAPAKAPGTLPPERRIYVPLWTEPMNSDRDIPIPSRQALMDTVWMAVPLSAAPLRPSIQPQGKQAILVEFRPATTMERSASGTTLVAVIRVSPATHGGGPLLEIVDRSTMLQSRGWGRLLRTTAGATDWIFTIPDPIPPLTGARTAVSRQIDLRPSLGRTFELRLVSEVALATDRP